jgi:hypothetical protein
LPANGEGHRCEREVGQGYPHPSRRRSIARRNSRSQSLHALNLQHRQRREIPALPQIHPHEIPARNRLVFIPVHPWLDFQRFELTGHRFPHGVLISRTAMYRSSGTRDASSTKSSDTAENPRIVSSLPGSPIIREPLGN